MGRQLIFCVETNKKSKTDYIYLKSTIDKLYRYDPANTKLSPVYMDGKGNYNSKRVAKDIKTLERKYNSTAPDNQSYVFYCFDCDEYDRNQNDMDFLQKTKEYCRQNSYEFIWFCRDIEHVYLGRQVSSHDKRNEAINFKKQEDKNISRLSLENMNRSSFQPGCSNVLLILDKYLDRS